MERERQEEGAAGRQRIATMDPPQDGARRGEPLDQAAPNQRFPEPGREESPSPAEAPQTGRTWDGDHAINLRISAPLPFFPFYLTIVAGRERRSKKRLKQDRRKHPIVTLGNMIFMGYSGAVIAIALGAIALTATIFIVQQLFEIEITLS